jgi:hypothetical protein
VKEHPPKDILERAFAALPEAEASDGFTPRVLVALESRRRARLSPAAWRWAAAGACLLLIIGVATGLNLRRCKVATADFTTRVQELRREVRQIEGELATLRRLAAERPSVIYLGGDERVDLILDLARTQPANGSRFVPAALGPTASETIPRDPQ